MSDLGESLKKLKFDNRMVKWNTRQNLLTEDEYKKHLENLKDVSDLQNTEEIYSSSTEEPVTEEPSTEEPVTEEPVTEEPSEV